MLKTLGKIDFKDIACNEEILVKHIVFPKDTDVAAVSQSLCAIQDDLISNITNELVRQLDVANMVRIVSTSSALCHDKYRPLELGVIINYCINSTSTMA